MTVPYTRTLPYVLREQFRSGDDRLQLLIGTVVSAPDARHVTLSIGGQTFTVPRLPAYAPTPGEPAYCVSAPGLILALGAVGGAPPTGAQGPAGTPGEKWFTGSGAPAGGTGAVGDWYLDSVSGDFYEKTGASAWTLRGNLKGPTGATGPAGPTGATGPAGPTGATGQAEGWSSGSGAPAVGLGAVGDWYLDTASGDVYEKTGASAWTLRGNIRGPAGPAGTPSDATTSAKGILQLAGDLAGTAASPQIAAGAIQTADFAASAKAPDADKLDGVDSLGFLRLLSASGLKIALGAITFTFSNSVASGNVTVNHGLGVTPIIVVGAVDNGGIANAYFAPFSLGPTSFLCRAISAVNATGTNVGYWLAIG